MNTETIRNHLPEYAKDIRINLENVLTTDGAPGLSSNQIAGIALTCAYATRHATLIRDTERLVEDLLSEAEIKAARAAASIMAMNNIYYRFVHLTTRDDFKRMNAKLRMTFIANPGIPKADFEMYALAVSAINGCGMCIDSHVGSLQNEQVSTDGIQSTIRIAAVMNAVAQTYTTGGH